MRAKKNPLRPLRLCGEPNPTNPINPTNSTNPTNRSTVTGPPEKEQAKALRIQIISPRLLPLSVEIRTSNIATIPII
jgi:hypothetical protein